MTLRIGIGFVGAMLLVLASVAPAMALTASCTGTPAASSITWSATATDGVAPFSYLWGNGSTSTSQTVNVSAGTHSMNLQVTDASSTVATTTCSATVQAAPTISSFTATPSAITVGQSSTLAWSVANASSTSISGIGAVTGTSTVVSPTANTTYTLTATNPGGTTTANATVTVAASSTAPGVFAQIQALLAQIDALKKQIAQIIVGAGNGGSGTGTTTPPTCFNFWRDLKHGDMGDDVRELQKQLAKEDPKLFPPGLVTGFFGPKTFAAVKVWQKRWGIDVAGTGFFGMKSRGYYASQCSNGDPDHDGLVNSQDPDDDNDGIPDLEDRKPFQKEKNKNKGRDNDDDDDDDDDDEEDDD